MKILSILRGIANLLSESTSDVNAGCCEGCKDTKRQCLENLEQAYQEVSYLIPQHYPEGVPGADKSTRRSPVPFSERSSTKKRYPEIKNAPVLSSTEGA